MKYYENFYKGGLVTFDGVKENVKPIKTLFAELSDNDSKLTVRVEYTDNSKEELKADVNYTDDESCVNLENVRLFWNEKTITGRHDNDGN